MNLNQAIKVLSNDVECHSRSFCKTLCVDCPYYNNHDDIYEAEKVVIDEIKDRLERMDDDRK